MLSCVSTVLLLSFLFAVYEFESLLFSAENVFHSALTDQFLLCIAALFLFFCFIGESFAMAAQTFLPGFIGRPKAAWNLARTLQKCALSMAFVVGISAGLFLFTCPFIFTKSPAIAAAIIEVTPFFASVMFFHCASMVSEGILLAGTWKNKDTSIFCWYSSS